MSPRVRCREIEDGDTAGVVNLLTRGFRERSRDFWVRAIHRLAEHPTPPGFPKYGYLLESEGNPVGVLFLIFSSVLAKGQTRIRCNVSSWYVASEFRSYATMLVSQALKHSDVTYYNITPAVHTLPILEAQGYQRFCSGRFVTVPVLCRASFGARVRAVLPDISPGGDLQSHEIELLLTHANYGCISVTCSSANYRCPFVFAPRWKFGVLPFAHLVYCRDLQDFVRFAGPLGRFLARRGIFLVVLDSNDPIRGLIGAYSKAIPKYFKGPDRPRLGDLAYSERAMFGV
jgi:hypothetical protein